VVLLRAPDSLIEHVTGEFAERGDPDVDLVEAAQNLVRRTVEQNRAPNSFLIVDVPDLPIGSGKPDETDLIFDTYVEVAFKAAQWLHTTHGGPALAQSDGTLGRLWRSVNP
jgi:hypothetical protein